MLRNTEVRVERHVSQLATLQEDRAAEVQSGHNSGLIRDRCARLVHAAVSCGSVVCLCACLAHHL